MSITYSQRLPVALFFLYMLLKEKY